MTDWDSLYARASRGDVEAARLLPMSEWAESRRSLMSAMTIAANARLHRESTGLDIALPTR